jgi:hypothetical protein
MSRFLDTTGEAVLGIGICDRCKMKLPLMKLGSDPNAPGLRVCERCIDKYDPWRLSPRQPDKVSLPFIRPDLPVVPPGGAALPATLTRVGDNTFWSIDGEPPAG